MRPPSTGQPKCDLDPSAPIDQWLTSWVDGVGTFKDCEALRTESPLHRATGVISR